MASCILAASINHLADFRQCELRCDTVATPDHDKESYQKFECRDVAAARLKGISEGIETSREQPHSEDPSQRDQCGSKVAPQTSHIERFNV